MEDQSDAPLQATSPSLLPTTSEDAHRAKPPQDNENRLAPSLPDSSGPIALSDTVGGVGSSRQPRRRSRNRSQRPSAFPSTSFYSSILFPFQHPKRTLFAIFVLLVASARLSSVISSTLSFRPPAPWFMFHRHPYPPPSRPEPSPLLSGPNALRPRSHVDAIYFEPSPAPMPTPAALIRELAQQDQSSPRTQFRLRHEYQESHKGNETGPFSEDMTSSQDDCTTSVDVFDSQSLAAPIDVLLTKTDSEFLQTLPVQFLHGVASGDALHDSIILWTKVTPTSNSNDSVTVRFEISDSCSGFDFNLPGSPPLGLGPVLFSGTVVTGPESDFTVKLDITDLTPSTTYYYRFSVTSKLPTSRTKSEFDNQAASPAADEPTFVTVASPTGRTTTLPHPNDASIDSLKFAVVSCSNLPFGFFHAYALIAARPEVEFVVHLGDYIYEYKNGEYGDGSDIGRIPVPDRELRTVEDYRIRHAQYKEDPDLQALHQLKPWIVIWDDHEFIDNVAGAAVEWKVGDRMPSAMQVYFEYLPVREPMTRVGTRKVSVLDEVSTEGNPSAASELESSQPTESSEEGFPAVSVFPVIYRTFSYGTLLDLIMLDTRINGRDVSDMSDPVEIADPSRTLLGNEQEDWFKSELVRSQERGAIWRAVGNQVVFSPIDLWGLMINGDAWDGYPANRRRILEFMRDKSIENTFVMTGDIHASFVFDVPLDPLVVNETASDYTQDSSPSKGDGAVPVDPSRPQSLLVEFVSPSVTSPSPLQSLGLGFLNPLGQKLLEATEPHLRFVDLNRRGYMILDVDRDRTTCEYWYVVDVRQRKPSPIRRKRSDDSLSGAALGLPPESLGAIATTHRGSMRVTKMEVF
ncbi:PhoD-like phosphatase-domain-containing protein [Zopfochytrium polystomum]|nr:PhoD-like phosphatase-domain-containing protein [Zopfochytrium polystomum]